MPGLTRKALQSDHSSSVSQAPAAGSGVDSYTGIGCLSDINDASFSRLNKFWSELPSAARRELLRMDKHTLFEQVRKNLYCSPCNRLLLEEFSQILLHRKNLQGVFVQSNSTDGSNKQICGSAGKGTIMSMQNDAINPSVHPWGGLIATHDHMLTVLDCFLDEQPLEVLQNVFDSGRVRERDRELLYPDACGGGERGWISQGDGAGSGKCHGLKKTCALHTAKLSCETLVGFWCALGEETRKSLLRMKEEDFIKRLLLRFDSKQFCRDCRHNVLREFKALKEPKRTWREPKCNRWFCAADNAFQYEVCDSLIQVDWKESFTGDIGSNYQHFEWGLGSGEGKSDILEFEDVGLSNCVKLDGFELGNVPTCFITVRACKCDGPCAELSVQAHAMKGQLCVHRRLVVGDGYVSITIGDSIKQLFEHAEDSEEEECDDAINNKKSGIENEGPRAMKHAKSPKLAQDFLLDAAIVIFKEKVEKAFREGNARQNAHTMFVCLALSLLEERLHVACKEITALEKQNKLLEEDEDKKREKEEKRERKRMKEKEKKMRRKEKMKGKEQDKGKDEGEAKLTSAVMNGCGIGAPLATNKKQEAWTDDEMKKKKVINGLLARPSSPEMMETRPSSGLDMEEGTQRSGEMVVSLDDIEDALSTRDGNGAFIIEQSKAARRRLKMRKGPFMDTISRPLSRRGPLNVVETGGAPWDSIRVASAQSTEIMGRLLCESQRYFNSTSKPHRNVVTKQVEGWNVHSQKGKDHQHCVFQHPESTIWYQAQDNYSSHIRTTCGLSRKKESRGIDTKNSKCILSREQHVLGLQQANSINIDSKGLTVPSLLNKGKTNLQLAKNTVVSTENLKSGVISTSMGATQSRTDGRSNPFSDDAAPFNRSPAASDLHSDGRTDGDSSQLSPLSCMTDAVDSMAYDTVFTGVQGGTIAAQASCISEKIFESQKGKDNNFSDAGLEETVVTMAVLDSATADGRRVVKTHPDLHLHPITSNLMPQTNRIMQGSQQSNSQNGMNPSFAPMVMSSTACHEPYPIQMPGIPSSILSLHSQESFEHYQVHRRWVTNKANGCPFSQSSRLFVGIPGGFGPSNDGFSTSSIPLPSPSLSSPSQSSPSDFGFVHPPSFQMESNLKQKKDLHLLSRAEGHKDGIHEASCKGLQSAAFLKKTRIPLGESLLDVSASIQSIQPSSYSDIKDNAFDASGFSLFHFGSPVVSEKEQCPFLAGSSEEKPMDNVEQSMTTCHRSLQQQSMGMTKMSIPLEEYSLFTATTSNRFRFF